MPRGINNKSSETQVFKNGKSMIIYPIFLECCKYTNDDFWGNIFEQLSYGKCPSCFYISGDTIYSSNKKKSFSFIINNGKHPRDIFEELRELVMTNTSLCSVMDTKEKRDKISAKVNKDEITDNTCWTEIRKKNLKEIFIIKYVIRMKTKYKLSWELARELYSIIQIGLITKTQGSKDIKFNNRRIQSINGIEYDKICGKFYNEYDDKTIYDEENDDEEGDKYLYYYWDKYVSSMSRVC